MVQQSKFNNYYSPLGIDGFFEGQLESTDGLVAISVNCLCDQPYQVIIRQYRANDRTTILQENSENIAADVKSIVQTPIKAQFFNVVVLNQSGGIAMLTTQITTILNSTHFINLDIRKLEADGGKEDSVLCYGVDSATGIKHPLNVDASGSLIVIGGGGGDASLWANYPAVADINANNKNIINLENITAQGYVATDTLQSNGGGLVSISVLNTLDMSGNNIDGVNSIIAKALTSPNDYSLSLSSGKSLTISGTDVVSIQTPSGGKDPNTLEFSPLGNLTFSEGEQNINNLLGVTHSQGFTLTQNGGGKIIFPDLTEQITAYTGGGGGGGNFSTPSDVILDMSSNDIINVSNIVSAPASHINIDGIDADSQVSINANTSGIGGVSSINVSPAGIFLNTRITGTEDVASASFLPTSGNFNAPFFVAQGFQPSVGTFQKGYIETPKVTSVERIEFSNSTVQTTAYTGADVRDITSTDDSITVSRVGNVVNLAVTSPFNFNVSNNKVLYSDGTDISGNSDFTHKSNTGIISVNEDLSYTSAYPIGIEVGFNDATYCSGIIVQNKNAGDGASAHILVQNDLGTDSQYYADFGINSSSSVVAYGQFATIPNAVSLSSQSSSLVITPNAGGTGVIEKESNIFLTYANGSKAIQIDDKGRLVVGVDNPTYSGDTYGGDNGGTDKVLTSDGENGLKWTTPSGGNPSTWSEYPATQAVDMDLKAINNVYELNGVDYVALTANSPVNNAGQIDIYTNYLPLDGAQPASEIILDNTGINLYTYPNGYADTTYNANLDMNGVFTAPVFKPSGLSGLGIDMNSKGIMNASSINATTDDGLYLNTTSTGEIYLRTQINSTPNIATFDVAGVFSAPALKANTLDGVIFSDNTVQTSGVQTYIKYMTHSPTYFDIVDDRVNDATVVVANWLGTSTETGILTAVVTNGEGIRIHTSVAVAGLSKVSVMYFITTPNPAPPLPPVPVPFSRTYTIPTIPTPTPNTFISTSTLVPIGTRSITDDFPDMSLYKIDSIDLTYIMSFYPVYLKSYSQFAINIGGYGSNDPRNNLNADPPPSAGGGNYTANIVETVGKTFTNLTGIGTITFDVYLQVINSDPRGVPLSYLSLYGYNGGDTSSITINWVLI